MKLSDRIAEDGAFIQPDREEKLICGRCFHSNGFRIFVIFSKEHEKALVVIRCTCGASYSHGGEIKHARD